MAIEDTITHAAWYVKISVSKIQDGEWPPFWKPINRHVPTTVWLILMKFCMVMHIGLRQGIDCWNFEFLNIQHSGATILKITKSSENVAQWCKVGLLTVLAVEKIEFYKSQMVDVENWKHV